jgi:hypothetical protein
MATATVDAPDVQSENVSVRPRSAIVIDSQHQRLERRHRQDADDEQKQRIVVVCAARHPG